MQNVSFGKIVHINPATGMIGIETRLGERLLVEANKCEALGLDVAIHILDGKIYAVESVAAWADVQDEYSASYRVAGLA